MQILFIRHEMSLSLKLSIIQLSRHALCICLMCGYVLPVAAYEHITIDARKASNAAEAEEEYQEAIMEHAQRGANQLHITLLLSGHVGFDPGAIELPTSRISVTTDAYIFGHIRRKATFSINELTVKPSLLVKVYSEINLR